MQAQTVSIGFIRDDGDLQVLATVNNNDELLTQEQFILLVEMQVVFYLSFVDKEIGAWIRQDAPDYVSEDSPFVEFKLSPEIKEAYATN